VTLDHLKDAVQSKFLRYDKKGDEHYDTISAFIKSMRASQPDAALYYLARMVEAGEDPKFIARRMVIFASEDVGLADAQALLIANAVFQAVETIGLPEAAINLAHGTADPSCPPQSGDQAHEGTELWQRLRTIYQGRSAAKQAKREKISEMIVYLKHLTYRSDILCLAPF
jgi:replication-associated recombination protein RarA